TCCGVEHGRRTAGRVRRRTADARSAWQPYQHSLAGALPVLPRWPPWVSVRLPHATSLTWSAVAVAVSVNLAACRSAVIVYQPSGDAKPPPSSVSTISQSSSL